MNIDHTVTIDYLRAWRVRRLLRHLPQHYEDGGDPDIPRGDVGVITGPGIGAGEPTGYRVEERVVDVPGFGDIHVWIRLSSGHRIQGGVVVGSGTWRVQDAYVPGMQEFDMAQLSAIVDQLDVDLLRQTEDLLDA